MAIERTLSIIKPDGVAKGHIGHILARFEEAGLKIVGMKLVHLTQREAEGFYAVHVERPFFRSLVKYMTSGPVVVSVLEGESAIRRNRELMGPTNAAEAPAGTIRGDFGVDIETNTAHGSDAPETAAFEIGYFFSATQLVTHA